MNKMKGFVHAMVTVLETTNITDQNFKLLTDFTNQVLSSHGRSQNLLLSEIDQVRKNTDFVLYYLYLLQPSSYFKTSALISNIFNAHMHYT